MSRQGGSLQAKEHRHGKFEPLRGVHREDAHLVGAFVAAGFLHVPFPPERPPEVGGAARQGGAEGALVFPG
jgi:hypothetical protein